MITSTLPESALRALPALPRDAEGPVFKAPWEAQAFAMAVSLHTRGVFTWTEWAAALASELAAAAGRGEPDDGTRYYEHWLAALEKLVAGKNVITPAELERRVDEWDAAARATPHGSAIELRRGEHE
jgi:nitrile hydratase accessory protein